MKPIELEKLAFQRDDRVPSSVPQCLSASVRLSRRHASPCVAMRRHASPCAQVQWTGADDDIPQGHIGQVMGVRYSGKSAAWTWQLKGPAFQNGHSE